MKRALSLLLALMLIAAPAETLAVDDGVGEKECLSDIAQAMAWQQRLYRGALFGWDFAANAPEGEVRYDADGTMYLKRGDNTWQPPTTAGVPLTNTEMDNLQEKDPLCASGAPSCIRAPYKGVFETRGTVTSDHNIIPALIQAQRALAYRVASVCDAAERSMTDKAGPTVEARVVGGLPITMRTFAGCKFSETGNWAAVRTTVTTRCNEIADGVIENERQLLELLVAYDAGVRSLYQFAGTFDRFLFGWQSTLTGPLWQLTRVMRWMPKIPCFLSVCSE